MLNHPATVSLSWALKAVLHCGWTQQWFSCCWGSSRRNWSHASPFCRLTIEKFHYSLSNVSGEFKRRSERRKRGCRRDCFKSDRKERNSLMKNVRLGDRQDKRLMAWKYHITMHHCRKNGTRAQLGPSEPVLCSSHLDTRLKSIPH